MSNLKDILHSFKTRDELCPDIWEKEGDSYKLVPKIRESLLEIANEFFQFLKIDVVLSDITLTGSLSNYNWSKFSDVDLHLIVDFKQFDEENIPLYEEFFLLKKTVFNDKHDIKILGYEVELYVQDENEEHTSTGVYSIMNDEWITEPKKENVKINYEYVKKKSEKWMKLIDSVLKEIDDEPLENAKNILKQLKDKIKKYRQCGLEKGGGEYSVENLVFKVLRRNGYIEKLFDKNNKIIDKKLTMKENYKFLNEDENSSHLELDVKNFYEALESINKNIYQESDGNYTSKPEVEAVQIGLDLLGYDLTGHEIDGKFGEETAKAIKQFRLDNYLYGEEMNDNVMESIKKSYILNENELSSPIPYMKVTHPFQEKRSYERHPGVDIPVPVGTEIKSPADGIIGDAEIRNNACGGTLKIEHENGFITRYCHCKKIFVSKGDKVNKGQVVALTGGDRGGYGSGNSTGPHLHFEVKKNGVLVNPVDYVDTTGNSYGKEEGGYDMDETPPKGESFISPKLVAVLISKLKDYGVTYEDLQKYVIVDNNFSEKMISNDLEFYESILDSLGAEKSESNLKFLMAWRQAEGGKAKNNPFNTSYKLTNDKDMTIYNCITSSGNGTRPIDGVCPEGTLPCVKNYSTKAYGLEATVMTLKKSLYSCIVDGLKQNKDPKEIANCGCLDTWGTRDGIKKVLSSGKVNPPEINS